MSGNGLIERSGDENIHVSQNLQELLVFCFLCSAWSQMSDRKVNDAHHFVRLEKLFRQCLSSHLSPTAATSERLFFHEHGTEWSCPHPQ